MLRFNNDTYVATVNFISINKATKLVEKITPKDYEFLCDVETIQELKDNVFTHSRYSNYLVVTHCEILSDYQRGTMAYPSSFSDYKDENLQRRVLLIDDVKEIFHVDDFIWAQEDIQDCPSSLRNLVIEVNHGGRGCLVYNKEPYMIKTTIPKTPSVLQDVFVAPVPETKKIDEKKGENKMNLMNNFEFGVYKNPNVKVSMQGLAVKDSAGKYVSYKNGVSTDVSDFIMTDFENGVMAMPVGIKKIKEGDIIVHAGKPMVIQAVVENEGKKKITAVDIAASEEKTIIPIKNVFGFDFYTKLVCMFDGMNVKADEDNPFGGNSMMLMMMMNGKGDGKMDMNSMLPLMLMGDSAGGENKDMAMMMLMMNGSGGKMDMNSLMPLMMMKGGLGDLF